MDWQYLPYTLPLIAVALILFILSIQVFERRNVLSAKAFGVLLLTTSWYALGYALEISATTLDEKIFWASVHYLAIVSLPVFWLIFAAHYTSQGEGLTNQPRKLALLFVVPVITLILVWTNQFHHLIWTQVRIDTSGPFPAFTPAYGVWFWIHLGYSYIAMLTGSIWFVIMLRYSALLYRRQAMITLVGALVPWIGNYIFLSGVSPIPNLDLTPFSLAISGIAFAYSLFYLGLVEVVPIARRAVIESMHDLIIVLDRQQRIIDLNGAAKRLIDPATDQTVGQPATKVLANYPNLTRHLEHGGAVRDELSFETKTRQHHFDLQITPLFNDHGRAIGQLVTLHDITGRKMAETSLARSEAKNRAILRAMPDLMVQLNRDGIYEVIHETDEQASAFPLKNIVGKSVKDVLPTQVAETHLYHIEQALETGNIQHFECQLAVQHQRHHFEIRLVPLSAQAVLGIIRDITERKRTEGQLRQAKDAAETANRAKNVFLANMGHELRTPLSAVIGYSEIVAEEVQEMDVAPIALYVEKIQEAGQHLAEVITDILDFSKIEAGRMTLEKEKFDVAQVINNLAITSRPLFERNGNTLKLDCAPDLGDMESDLSKVHQILFNLLSNATKFTQEGVVTVRAKRISMTAVSGGARYQTDPVNESSERICISISDTGIGIDAVEAETLFAPFVQADDSITREYGGTGLGLAISRRFCHMLGGEITAQGELGRGATFSVWLPTNLAVREGSASEAESKKSTIKLNWTKRQR